MWRALREWERTILWICVAGLSLTVAFLFSRLAAEKAARQVMLQPTHSPPSYLNEATAFQFLEPAPAPSTSARNPFAFSCRVPPAKAATPPAARSAGTGDQPPTPVDPQAVSTTSGTATGPSTAALPPPPAPKRTTSILYRGLYSGGRDVGQQLAFVSTRETPGAVSATAVLAPGQQAGGVTIKRFTPAELVVAGPGGVEVSIAVGTQVQIALE